MAIAGKKARLKISGTAIVFTDEATTTSDNLTYQITNAVKRVWDRTVTIVVEDGGVPTVEVYTINRLTGTVTFGSAVVRTITVTGSYLPMAVAAECYDYNYSIEADNQDSTQFGDTFIHRVQGLLDVSGSISRFYAIDDVFIDKILAGEIFVIEFYTDFSQAADILVWAILASDEDSASVDGLVEEGLEFEGTADANGRVVSIA